MTSRLGCGCCDSSASRDVIGVSAASMYGCKELVDSMPQSEREALVRRKKGLTSAYQPHGSTED